MHPDLFRIGPVIIHSYGTLLMLGFICGILLSRREARRLGVSPDLPLDLGVWILIASVVFARALFVAMNWVDFSPYPLSALYVWREGGLSFHGGLLGGVMAVLAFAHRNKLSFWLLADVMTPGLVLGYGIARFGCLLNGCCYGAPTDLPWGICFPYYADSQITTEPSHPTQIYSALGSFFILAVLMLVRTRLSGRGQLFCLYLALYSPLRALIEILRKGYTAQVLFDGITQGQAASALIFICAVAGFILLGKRAQVSSAKQTR